MPWGAGAPGRRGTNIGTPTGQVPAGLVQLQSYSRRWRQAQQPLQPATGLSWGVRVKHIVLKGAGRVNHVNKGVDNIRQCRSC